MYIDALGLVSDAQAFSATGVSTNSIDLGNVTPKREIGTGEPMGFAVAVDVALAGTTPTLNIDVISATDGPLTAGILVHVNVNKPAADWPAGSLHFLPIPPGAPTQRFLGIRANLGGTTPTVTLTAWLTTWSLFSILAKSYAKGYTIS